MTTAAPAAPPAPAASPKLRATFDRAMKLMDRMQAIADGPDESLAKKAADVSGWSVGEHLDHAAATDKVLIMAIEVCLMKNDPNVPPPKFLAKIVLFTGVIPRGKGNAPEMTKPKAKTAAEVRENLKKARASLDAIGKKLDKIEACANRAPHPVLGGFTPAQWVRFIEIHQNHHLKIVADIQKR